MDAAIDYGIYLITKIDVDTGLATGDQRLQLRGAENVTHVSEGDPVLTKP
jgi:hypothetical protein